MAKVRVKADAYDSLLVILAPGLISTSVPDAI